MSNIDEQIEAARLEHVRLVQLKREEELVARQEIRRQASLTMTSINGTKVNPKKQWQFALKTARDAGVKIKQNVFECCRGCITNEKLGLPANDETTPYAYTYGGQGGALYWNEDGTQLATRSDRADNVAYFNHGNGAGEIVANAFRLAGFTVEFESENHCVIVSVPTAEEVTA